jgi:hypothetical protein
MDSFDGSVEAVSGGGGNGPSGSAGDGGAGSGGYAATASDLAALGIVGGAGAIGGATGALGGVFGLSLLGLNPAQAAIDLAHDMALGLGTGVTANPSISMFVAGSAPAGSAPADFGQDSAYGGFVPFAGPQ